jgi:hypothetical protein
MIPLIADPEDVDADWLSAVLAHAGLPGTVTEFSAEEIGTGQMGRNVRFQLSYGNADPGPLRVVAKFPASDPISRQTGAAQNTYQREIMFYDQLASRVDIRVPEVLFCAVEPVTQDFVLVMEDLHPAQQGDQLAGCGLEHAQIAMRELARLHGPTWNDEANRQHDWLSQPTPEGMQLLTALYQGVWPGFVERYAERLAPEHLAVAEQLGEHLDVFADSPDDPFALIHGDYRLDNMMFGPDPYPLAVVDWQTVGTGHPVSDASYFIGAGLLPDERRRHERTLMETYREGLEAYGIDYGRDACWNAYRRLSFAGIRMAVIASMIVVQTDRGDDMFMVMASRHAQQALDLDALEFFTRD